MYGSTEEDFERNHAFLPYDLHEQALAQKPHGS